MYSVSVNTVKRGVCLMLLAFFNLLLYSDKKLLRQTIYHWEDLVWLFQMVFFFFVISFFSTENFIAQIVLN